MRKYIGHRKPRSISFSASGTLLAEGARFNDELHQFPTGNLCFIPKGVYRFKTHEEANLFDQEYLAKGMARIALERRNGNAPSRQKTEDRAAAGAAFVVGNL
ncbi:MAG: hypothetical protein LBB55_05735 [Zoogloeaceae bacterium]|nr:hypothetical protein [Zoogloeaceae bacterium]